MSVNAKQFRELIIKPTLVRMSDATGINFYSQAAENLLAGTAAQESRMGEAIKQFANGIALGMYQVEPPTLSDLCRNFIGFNSKISKLVQSYCPESAVNFESQIIGDFYFATVICRLHYYRVKEALPDAGDLNALAAYYKKYYNTPLGKATEQEFVDNYKKFAL